MNLEDLGPVLTELFAVREKWFNIGLQLSIPVKELQKIFSEHKNDHSTGLRLMLIKWLKMGEASWKALCRALSSQIVEESALAKKLQQKYCSATGLPGQRRSSVSKGTKRSQPEDSSAPNTKRKKTELPSSFAPEDFLRTQPTNRLCAKCRRVPQIPLRPECCSHKIYCEPCSQKTTMCLTHRQDIVYTVDKELQASIPKLQVHCPNRQRGCELTAVLYKVYKEHVPICTKQRKGSRPHNITIPSVEHTGDRERTATPTTPSTPLSTPMTPTHDMNPPSPMLHQLKSLTGGSAPGSPIATQPPASPRDTPKQPFQQTNQQIFTTESLAASSQVKQQLLSSATVPSVPLMSREPSQIEIPTSTESNPQHMPVATSAGIFTSSANVARQQATPTKVTAHTSICSEQLRKVTDSAKRVTLPQAAKQIPNSISTATLTRPPLRHQQTSSTECQQSSSVTYLQASSVKDSVVTQTLTKQPPKPAQIQPTLPASSKQTSSGTDSVVSQTCTQQPPKSTQIQPTIPATTASDGQFKLTQQSGSTVTATQKQKASTSPPQPQQMQPAVLPIVGISYQPSVHQTLSMMGVPMHNLPLILQHANVQSPINVTYSTVGAQITPATMQSAAVQPQTGKAVAKNITKPQAKKSGGNSTQNVTGKGGREPQKVVKNKQVSNNKPSTSVTSSSIPTTSTSHKSVSNVVVQTISPHKMTSAEHTKSGLPTSVSNSPTQKGGNDRVKTIPGSKVAPPTTKGSGRTASKKASQPTRYNSGTPTTSGSTASFQTVASSPKSTTQHVPQTCMSAKNTLNFSGSATTSSNSSKGALQTTPTRSSNNGLIQSIRVSSKDAHSKLTAKAEGSTSASNLTIALSNGQKMVINTQQSLLCSVCQRIPRNPLRSECCGGLYCQLCSRKIEKCPQHKCLLKFKRDMELFNIIQKQQTKCKYAGNGCTWTGVVAEQMQHMTVCVYNPSRVQLERTVKKDGMDFAPSPKSPRSPKLPSSGMSIKKEKIEQHISSPKLVKEYQPCEYVAIGCTEQVANGKMELHLQEAVQYHLDLAIKRILMDEMTKL